MLLSRKLKRKMSNAEMDAIIERSKTEEPLELEKGDITAMLIAGFVVFMPVVLAIGGTLAFLYWFFFNVWAG
jgi:hypothetical protein